MNRFVVCCLLVLVPLVACSSPDAGTSWQSDIASTQNQPVGGPSIDLDGAVARFGVDCGQLELGGVRTWCPGFSSPGDQTTALRVGDDRVVWILRRSGGGDAETDARFAPIDHAVVWSSASPEGRRVEVAVSGDLQQMAWFMEDGEEPWGVQLIDARGRLIATHHLVGLSGTGRRRRFLGSRFDGIVRIDCRKTQAGTSRQSMRRGRSD